MTASNSGLGRHRLKSVLWAKSLHLPYSVQWGNSIIVSPFLYWLLENIEKSKSSVAQYNNYIFEDIQQQADGIHTQL